MLIYDGACRFCTRSARWAECRLPAGPPVVPWQQIEDPGAYGLGADDVTSAAYWIDEHGGQHRGEAAVAAVLKAMGGAWVAGGRVLGAPPTRWVAGRLYGLVARHRHRLPGGTAACRLPGC